MRLCVPSNGTESVARESGKACKPGREASSLRGVVGKNGDEDLIGDKGVCCLSWKLEKTPGWTFRGWA